MMRCYQCMNEYGQEYEMCPYCGYVQDTPPKELYFLNPGTVIAGRYEIGVSIGSGGFGISYKAWDNVLSKTVAIKEYYPAGLVNRVPGTKEVIIYKGSRQKECAGGKLRFLEEARNMAKFNGHPQIVHVYDFFEENNTAYFVMEFLEGMNYKEYIKQQGGRVSVEKAVEVTKAVLNALTEVHKNGIIHRDISPDNIFICNDGRIKLIDFGAARFSAAEDIRTRSVILKPGFAPPEQYQTKSRQGPFTDIYAVAATMYRAITGNVPEESSNRTEEDLLVDPAKLCPEVSANLNNIIIRAMAVQPELRFQKTTDFLDALNRHGSVRDVRKELKARKLRRISSAAAICILLAAGAGICFGVLMEKKNAAAILEPAAISIWIPAESGEMEAERIVFEEAIAQFQDDYPQIEIELQCIDEKVYRESLNSAAETGNLPTLFESTGLDEAQFDKVTKLSKVFDFIDAENYFFLNQYRQYFPSQKQMPMAFTVPVIYYNTSVNLNGLSGEELVRTGDFLLEKGEIINYYNIYGGKKAVVDFKRLDGYVRDLSLCYESIRDKVKNAKERFANQEASCLLSDSSKYNWIQQQFAGIYKMDFALGGNVVGAFQDCFSISQAASRDEKAAAIQVLVYLLTDTAQDIRYVQNGSSLPLNKSVYNAYIEINKEFEALSGYIGQIHFAGEYQSLMDAWYEEIE